VVIASTKKASEIRDRLLGTTDVPLARVGCGLVLLS
jgi:hypothetical protein